MTIRPGASADHARLAAIRNRQEPDLEPQTADAFRESLSATGALLVADEAGYARFDPAWWTGDPHAFAVEVRVAPEAARRGVGGRLFTELSTLLAQRDARRLTAWVRDDAPEGLAFARSRGFVETGQTLREFRLNLEDAPTTDAPSPAGLRVAALADLPDSPALLLALHALWSEGAEPPSDLGGWTREVVDGPGLSRQTHWVALDGDRPVGMTFLRRLSDTAAENDFTGVSADWRGRGVASALKRAAIVWARANGLKRFYTSSEVNNAPMIAVNTRLGYRPGALRREVMR